jgi:hypothetical protein
MAQRSQGHLPRNLVAWNLCWPVNVMYASKGFVWGDLILHCAMKLKSKRSISFPWETQAGWLPLTITLMLCYAAITALGLLRALSS